jgi:hypothetical protein
MQSTIQPEQKMKSKKMTTLPIGNSISRSPLRYGFFLIALVCLAFSPTANNAGMNDGVLNFSKTPLLLPQPTFTTFDPAGSADTFPNSINPAGAITGRYFDANFVAHGFVRAPDGTITTFDAPDDVNGTFANSITQTSWLTASCGPLTAPSPRSIRRSAARMAWARRVMCSRCWSWLDELPFKLDDLAVKFDIANLFN